MRQQLASLLRRVADRLDPAYQAAKEASQQAVWVQVNQYVGQVERYIADLESYIERESTCVVCEASLLRSEAPPHCEYCRPEDEAVLDWEAALLRDPVAELRRKHLRCPPLY